MINVESARGISLSGYQVVVLAAYGEICYDCTFGFLLSVVWWKCQLLEWVVYYTEW